MFAGVTALEDQLYYRIREEDILYRREHAVPVELKRFVPAFRDHLDPVVFAEFYAVFACTEDDDLVDRIEMVQKVQVGFDIEQSSYLRVLAVERVDIVASIFIWHTEIISRDGELLSLIAGDRFGDTVFDLEHNEVSQMLFFSFAGDGERAGMARPALHSLV